MIKDKNDLCIKCLLENKHFYKFMSYFEMERLMYRANHPLGLKKYFAHKLYMYIDKLNKGDNSIYVLENSINPQELSELLNINLEDFTAKDVLRMLTYSTTPRKIFNMFKEKAIYLLSNITAQKLKILKYDCANETELDELIKEYPSKYI